MTLKSFGLGIRFSGWGAFVKVKAAMIKAVIRMSLITVNIVCVWPDTRLEKACRKARIMTRLQAITFLLSGLNSKGRTAPE